MYRRLSSSKINYAENSHVEHTPNTYEMSSDSNSQPTYSTIDVQSEASAPATYSNATDNDKTQPPAAPDRSRLDNDFTLIDNDLYQLP